MNRYEIQAENQPKVTVVAGGYLSALKSVERQLGVCFPVRCLKEFADPETEAIVAKKYQDANGWGVLVEEVTANEYAGQAV